MKRPRALFAALGLCLLAGGSADAARPVVADLSNHLVAITTGFSGTHVLVFGATDERKGDIVMVVRGPQETHVVREKTRLAGVWMNRTEAYFSQVPAFYAVAATAPLDSIVPPEVRKHHQIGVAALELSATNSDGRALPADEAKRFREALIRLKSRAGLYPGGLGNVTTLENRLFRAELDLPATVPVGSYTVEVFFVQDGGVIGAEITPLFVSKTGFSAEVFDFAMYHAVQYALAAIAFAALSGWGIALVFRR
ncbi:TIGR02186 family protein [Oleispirillum naphthae]|uniref:TIGR02186 family protein n=1 Tax=Oleispirillum naphthae TaxID=2838853 RepID=UPI00308239D0